MHTAGVVIDIAAGGSGVLFEDWSEIHRADRALVRRTLFPHGGMHRASVIIHIGRLGIGATLLAGGEEEHGKASEEDKERWRVERRAWTLWSPETLLIERIVGWLVHIFISQDRVLERGTAHWPAASGIQDFRARSRGAFRRASHVPRLRLAPTSTGYPVPCVEHPTHREMNLGPIPT